MRIGHAVEDIAEVGDQLLLDPLRARHAQEVESLEAFAFALVAMEVTWREQRKQSLKTIGKLLTKDMRAQIGVYQPEVGNYPEWAPLAESTEDEKARIGAPPDAPLERLGDLKKSFRWEVHGIEEVIAGSTDPNMDWHEFGTSKMPPRPVVGPALYKNIDRVRELLGVAILDSVLVGQRMGYRFNAEEGGIAVPGDDATP
jgi:hypothetical protein